jgi:hypothetical protein
MIKKTSLRKLSHNELITLCLRIITAIEAVVAINTGVVAKALELLKGWYHKFVPVVNRSLKNELVELLKEKDNIRDDAFRTIRDVILGYSRCLNPVKKQMAVKLLKIFERHGWTLYLDGYQDESAELNLLISELEMPENLNAITTLNISDLFEDVKSSQKDFEDAFYNKANAAVKEDYSIITATRPQLITSLNNLLERIDSDSKFAEDAKTYKDLTNTINSILSETATIVKSRTTRNIIDDSLPETDKTEKSK